MISVREALDHILALSDALPSEDIALQYAQGRVLAQTVTANRDQPPFAAAAMDGYAIRATDLAAGAQTWQVIGESAAGHPFSSPVAAGQATRIFTGAPLPQGTDHVLIQENVCAKDGQITLIDGPNDAAHRRPAGGDFTKGHQLRAPRRLSAQDIALLAAMNVPRPNVTRRPKVALIATGDELVQPGDAPRDDQIIASNSYGLAAMLQKAGAEARILPIARDRLGSLAEVFALTRDADLVLTIGGASVGDYDLVAQAAAEFGLEQSFYKVAMRPGKPLMAGRMGGRAMIGLPGNPVSAMVCGEIFVVPLIEKMLGLPARQRAQQTAPLAHDLPANGAREHYMRATLIDGALHVATRQDSSLLSILSGANALAIAPIQAPAMPKGSEMRYIPL
ncbi:molybdopterin molybdotransferase MoeA [Planktomarina temperata]|uniref:molybdopterin molybdotransferase MoeA n=1 Tax=Planktomarina sp. TaxID=2024851 RepID=UPI002304C0C5|nr:molybdopterin molybdotransferase MoeA [Planktomarina temperata]MDB4019965.1 molybdopterin molybdotransferase MoeA [Planktomarina temperata]